MTHRYEHWKKSSLFYQSRKLTPVRVVEHYGYPKHFMVTNAAYSDPEDYIHTDDEFESAQSSEGSISFERDSTKDSLADDMDLDFMMPSRVREILRSEGIAKDVIDKSVRPGEKKYRMALYLTIQQQKSQKVSKETKKQTQKGVTLPKIPTDSPPRVCESSHVPGCECCHDVMARRQQRHTRVKPWCERIPSPEDNIVSAEEPISITEHAIEDGYEFCLTDAEKIKWFSEQQFEKAMVGSNFDPPRLVLVSSKIAKHSTLQKVLLPNVVFIVYDFELASFNDIIEQISNKLESIKTGCKAKSILLLCQGGPGYLYVLRKIAVTPQKMKKESYKSVREFWRNLSNLVSKINQNDSAIHITGCGLGENYQGREVVRFIQRLIQGNMVKVYAHDDQTEKGQKFISHYFNKRWFNIWKSQLDESDEEIDFERIEKLHTSHSSMERESETSEPEFRTWSSLAAELDDET